MRTKALRAVAVTLGLSACAVTQAQDTYKAPSKWSNFRVVADGASALQNSVALQDAVGELAEAADQELAAPAAELPPPAPEPMQGSSAAPQQDMTLAPPIDSATGSSPAGSGYSQAMSSPWEGSAACSTPACATRPPLSRCFGAANLLFLTLERGHGNLVATNGAGSNIYSGAVDPSSTVGFDATIGSYIGCGLMGIGVTYFHWNPETERIIYNGAAGDYVPHTPRAAGVTVPSGDVYALIDTQASDIRVGRDMFFQGIEANLFSFGLMGARRAAYMGCNSGGCFGGKPGIGYGGAAGPLVRACTGRARIMTSHGFRWFQVNDDFEIAYNTDGAGGYQPTDIYEDNEVDNNLFGYQFGAMLNYCINSRLNMNIGGKFGLYGNSYEVNHRIYTDTGPGYLTAAGVDDVNTRTTGTQFATLGEFDLGLGYRISNAWSIRGGYRLLSVCGIVDATDLPTDYTSIATASYVSANDCLILHGGYVGLTYNW